MTSNEAMIRDIEDAIDEYEKLIGYAATRTHRMIAQKGYQKALSDLMVSRNIQAGLKRLARAGKSDRTFEAIVLRYPGEFRGDVREAAEWRLTMAQRGEL